MTETWRGSTHLLHNLKFEIQTPKLAPLVKRSNPLPPLLHIFTTEPMKPHQQSLADLSKAINSIRAEKENKKRLRNSMKKDLKKARPKTPKPTPSSSTVKKEKTQLALRAILDGSDLSETARKYGLSKSTLGRQIVRCFGMSFNQVRMYKNREELRVKIDSFLPPRKGPPTILNPDHEKMR